MCMNDPTYTKPEKPKAISAFVDVEPKVEAVNTLRVDTVKAMADEQSAQTTFNNKYVHSSLANLGLPADYIAGLCT